MTKIKLRKHFKKTRQTFVLSQDISIVTMLLHELARRVGDAEILAGAIGGYAAMISELDPRPILDMAAKAGRVTALPYFGSRHAEMEFRRCDNGLEKGPFGIQQPRAEDSIVSPDTLLVPLVAADDEGNRIGQGQGHYDQYLAKARREKPMTAIGIAWECQIAAHIPADPWDEPLDYIATPERIIEVTS